MVRDQVFTSEDIQMANKQENMLSFTSDRKIPIKTTIK